LGAIGRDGGLKCPTQDIGYLIEFFIGERKGKNIINPGAVRGEEEILAIGRPTRAKVNRFILKDRLNGLKSKITDITGVKIVSAKIVGIMI